MEDFPVDPVLCQDRRQEGGKSFLAATLRSSQNENPGCFRLETPMLSDRLEKVGRPYLVYGCCGLDVCLLMIQYGAVYR